MERETKKQYREFAAEIERRSAPQRDRRPANLYRYTQSLATWALAWRHPRLRSSPAAH
jgi:hypothetical protein